MLQDLRFAVRILVKNPAFTLVVVLTLALSIGANTAVFSIVNAVVLRPLPFPNSDRLMAILSTAAGVKEPFQSAPGVFVDWRERTMSFDRVAGARPTRMIMSSTHQSRFVSIAAISFDFFPLIGVQPVLGRTFTKDEDQPGRGTVVLLDGGFWRREFGGNANVMGQTIILNDKPYNIIGVLPPGIRFAHFGATDVWIPLAANRSFRTGGDVVVVAQLRQGVTRGIAQTEMEVVMRGIQREHIEDSKTGVVVKPLHDWIVGDVRRTFLTLLGAVVFVLLICCANIANLLMARSTARQKEMAIRASLGAGRFRLVRQTLVESVLLAFMGGALGFGLALVLVRAVPRIRAFYIPRVEEIAVDQTVLFVAAIVSLASGILLGLAPAFQIGLRNLGVALRTQSSGRPGGQRLRNSLVVIQLALALVLLCGAGLMTNSLLRLLNIELGFERHNVITISTSLPSWKYDRNRGTEFRRRLLAEVSRMPGVDVVSASDNVPLQAVLFPYEVRAENGGVTGKCEALARHVAPNYLRVMGIPLLAGRDLETADDTRKPVPVLINKKAAGVLFGADDPIGKHLLTLYGDREVLEVVGVVGDARQIGLTKEPGPQLYVPLAYGSAGYVVARTVANAGDLAGAIRAAVRAIDPEVPAPEVSTLDTIFAFEMAKSRFYLMLLGMFAAAGVILAAVGIYGVMSYSIAQRTHEFGVRIALGAERENILRLILRDGMRLTCVGAALGLAGSIALTRLLSTMLYGVRPNDPFTFGCVLVLLVGISLLPCYIAARRAAAVDPNIALRCE